MTDKKNQKTDTNEEEQQEENKGLRHSSGGGWEKRKKKRTLEFDRHRIWKWWTDLNFHIKSVGISISGYLLSIDFLFIYLTVYNVQSVVVS